MNVNFELVNMAVIDANQLDDTIEDTFGFRYNISEKEKLISEFYIKMYVTRHVDAVESDDAHYKEELSKIKAGICPKMPSLHIILNELCERGQIGAGNYII